MVNLEHVQTPDLMSELVRRTIANKDYEASPYSLLELTCLMASVFGKRPSFLFSEALRDAADHLENLNERV